MPTDGRAFELFRLDLGEQGQVGQSILERRRAELAKRRLDRPKVALLDRAGEAAMRTALRGHERMFAHPFCKGLTGIGGAAYPVRAEPRLLALIHSKVRHRGRAGKETS